MSHSCLQAIGLALLAGTALAQPFNEELEGSFDHGQQLNARAPPGAYFTTTVKYTIVDTVTVDTSPLAPSNGIGIENDYQASSSVAGVLQAPVASSSPVYMSSVSSAITSVPTTTSPPNVNGKLKDGPSSDWQGYISQAFSVVRPNMPTDAGTMDWNGLVNNWISDSGSDSSSAGSDSNSSGSDSSIGNKLIMAPNNSTEDLDEDTIKKEARKLKQMIGGYTNNLRENCLFWPKHLGSAMGSISNTVNVVTSSSGGCSTCGTCSYCGGYSGGYSNAGMSRNRANVYAKLATNDKNEAICPFITEVVNATNQVTMSVEAYGYSQEYSQQIPQLLEQLKNLKTFIAEHQINCYTTGDIQKLIDVVKNLHLTTKTISGNLNTITSTINSLSATTVPLVSVKSSDSLDFLEVDATELSASSSIGVPATSVKELLDEFSSKVVNSAFNRPYVTPTGFGTTTDMLNMVPTGRPTGPVSAPAAMTPPSFYISSRTSNPGFGAVPTEPLNGQGHGQGQWPTTPVLKRRDSENAQEIYSSFVTMMQGNLPTGFSTIPFSVALAPLTGTVAQPSGSDGAREPIRQIMQQIRDGNVALPSGANFQSIQDIFSRISPQAGERVRQFLNGGNVNVQVNHNAGSGAGVNIEVVNDGVTATINRQLGGNGNGNWDFTWGTTFQTSWNYGNLPAATAASPLTQI
uniref:ARAD1B06006p n=1 Tax=Blastobotrys adeninivorans TaxID=409370 RepID=A0A060TAB5_BLAAD